MSVQAREKEGFVGLGCEYGGAQREVGSEGGPSKIRRNDDSAAGVAISVAEESAVRVIGLGRRKVEQGKDMGINERK